MSAAIEIASVVKRYGSFEALRGVSLSIREGEFFGLLGPNGAGKTTLISIVAGLSRPDSGEVRVMGHEVSADYRAARRALGVVPQELVFDPFFTVRETLRITSGYYGIRRNDDWIDEILAHLDLSGKADSNMRALSGGMKRRVLVAQALVHRPPVIVLDEPTAGVDVELRQTLWQFIRRLNRDGHTIVLTTHYLEEAQELCGRIAMLKQGQVVALDDTSALLRRFAGGRLQLALSGAPLPEALAPLRLDEGGQAGQPAGPSGEPAGLPQKLALRVDDYAGIEGILAALREGGCRIDEMELQHADLEDVFVQIMKDNR
ncbi:MAG: ABC transporter ATP-binding protein [Lautropia sp. SCN 70-15]|nr:MAG: ABC transporter ATP-binding protein [Lautropia sp. SCN 70-15]